VVPRDALSSLWGREFFVEDYLSFRGALCATRNLVYIEKRFLAEFTLSEANVLKMTTQKIDLTFHLVPKEYFDALDVGVDYTPGDFARDGFIHCTDGAEEMARTANRYYQLNAELHYYLYIDKARVHAPIRYDDAAQLYPHIYGALNRDAIIAVRAARRETDGTFLAPESLEN
jgi:uncharacterized protein (DUF952 family)